MFSLRQYIEEQGTKGLTIFDIDETMFKTKAKVGMLVKMKMKTKSLADGIICKNYTIHVCAADGTLL